MFEKLVAVTEFLWGTPLMILTVGVGFFLTYKIGFFQFTHIRYIFQKTIGTMFGKNTKKIEGKGKLSPFQALSTVLAGTVGSGNIAGVASAIAIGGPGSVFWMWVISLFGMVTKMTEVTLAVHYRKKGENGDYYGGPMHYIKDGLGSKWKTLASVYAIALLILVVTDATFIQPNTMATAVQDVFGIPLIITGVVSVLISMIIIVGGGVKRIGEFCSILVPPMCIIYIIAALGVAVVNINQLPEVFALIFKYAFAPSPAVGGFVGSTIMMAMSRGASRGIFSNEAGLGTASTVHATAITDHPIRQGMWGVIEVFVDTGIICNLTAFAILSSGEWSSGVTGAPLTFAAFRTVWGDLGLILVCIAVVLFTYSSTLGFFVEYKASINYLFGEKAEKVLKWFYFVPPIIAVIMPIEVVWTMADMACGFLMIPNLIALVALSGVFAKLFKDFLQKDKIGSNDV
ncbi:amino acid carrier protein [Clostridium sediminicola]|uniref:alanine/glycine:cation symporter family protein n=1 Tax=Clostridium sediminicola TaxID=3114879 RepID=UPI0031F25062